MRISAGSTACRWAKSFCGVFIFFIISSIAANAQDNDRFARDIAKNIFRTTLTFIVPDDEGTPLLFSYERQLYKPITIVAGVGISLVSSINDESELAIHGFASIELRYYFNLMHRVKKEKYVRNFSATYLSLQESLFSGPIALIGVSSANASTGAARTFFNLGLQRQWKKYYLNIFLGPGLHFSGLEKGEWVLIEDFHAGISFGFVLFE
jgi:hypothetical protein